jgi:voltage-gated potassium channel
MSTFPHFRQLFRGLRIAFRQPEVRALAMLAGALIALATVFYRVWEGWSLLDSLYFSVVTIATVGYGDLAPKTALGKIFTIGYIFAGIGIFVSAATAIAQAVIGTRDGKE